MDRIRGFVRLASSAQKDLHFGNFERRSHDIPRRCHRLPEMRLKGSGGRSETISLKSAVGRGQPGAPDGEVTAIQLSILK